VVKSGLTVPPAHESAPRTPRPGSAAVLAPRVAPADGGAAGLGPRGRFVEIMAPDPAP